MRTLSIASTALLLALPSASFAGEAQTATGVVYLDGNANGVRDPGERGIARVPVSNGREVVRTDNDGSYELPVDDDTIIFVCKPTRYRTHVDGNGLARFYYIHKPNGSPDLLFGGVEPTGPLPDSIDFGLVPQEEPSRFNVILFGDPQPYSIQEVDYLARDIVPEVIDFVQDEGAAFGVTLGDIVGDRLTLFGPHNDVVGAIGLPWVNVHGNHDMDFDAESDEHADETFNRVYGPTTYAFAYGGTHFIVLDNVIYSGGTPERPKGSYTAGLTEEQAQFVQSYVGETWFGGSGINYVFLTHIPIVEHDDFLNELGIAYVEPKLSFAAHWHRQKDFFMTFPTRVAGYEFTHHHLVHATTSGSWWQGNLDEYGVPHALMRDGKPNGWSVLTIDPELPMGYEVRFKAAGMPWERQMHVHAPDVLWAGDRSGDAEGAVEREPEVVTVNLWSGSELSTAEVRYVHAQSGDATGWRTMTMTEGTDPYWARLKALEERGESSRLTDANPATLLWIDEIPAYLRPGSYRIEVRSTNMYGHEHSATRVLRVLERGAAE